MMIHGVVLVCELSQIERESPMPWLSLMNHTKLENYLEEPEEVFH